MSPANTFQSRSSTAVALIALIAFVVTLGASTTVAGASASTADDSTAAEEVTVEVIYDAIGVDATEADYIIGVDTSLSMIEDDRYGKVAGALSPFLSAMTPVDHLGLSTFDETPTLEFTSQVGDSGPHLASLLPSTPEGGATDIGAALSQALAELERPDANDVASVVFITDGRHEPPPGSRFPATTGATWDELGARASAVAEGRTVNTYAIALTGSTDAELVNQVFGNTVVVDLPADQIAPFLDRVKEETRRAKAADILQDDVTVEVRAEVAVPSDPVELSAAQSVEMQITLTSSAQHIPLEVANISVVPDGTWTGLVIADPELDSLVLQPGEHRSFTVTATVRKVGGFGLGLEQVNERSDITVKASVSSPWTETLSENLGMTPDVQLVTPTATMTGEGTTGWSWTRLATIALCLLIGAAITRAVIVSRRPTLRGVLDVQGPDGTTVIEAARLNGNSATFGKGPLREAKGRLKGTVKPLRRKRRIGRGTETGLRLSLKAGGRRHRLSLWPGDRRTVADHDFTLTS